MSKTEILDELPRLQPEERRQVFDRLWELEERDLLAGVELTAWEKTLLDRELADFRNDPDAGSTWEEVEARLLNRPRQ